MEAAGPAARGRRKGDSDGGQGKDGVGWARIAAIAGQTCLAKKKKKKGICGNIPGKIQSYVHN